MKQLLITGFDPFGGEEISCASCGAAFDIEFGTCDGNCAACSEECEPEGEE